jgi:acyl-CoA hydrolase
VDAPTPLDAAALDLVGLIRSGDRILVGQGTAEPLSLTEALVSQRHRIGPVDVFLGAVFSDTFAPDRTDGMSFRGYGGIGGAAALAAAGRLDVLPTPYGRLHRHALDGTFAVDVVLLQLAPSSGAGPMSLGLANDHVAAAAKRARLVIAEVNDQVPWTFGAELPEDLSIHHVVNSSRPLVLPKAAAPGEVEAQIARHVAERVPEGATLQMGIGAIPEAIMPALKGHRDLGIHSGMIGDAVVGLIETGAVTNAKKADDTGITVAGALFGGEKLIRFADRNRSLRVAPPSVTHAVEVMARLPRFTAINSAVEVDLTGQVNAEVAGGRYVGAVGGQPEFVRGALESEGGRSIIALPATARRGEISRIVPVLSGVPVTTPRSDADLVVTEFGVAELRGCALAERARRMIAIAAPQFREGLERAWREMAKGA